MKQYRVIFHFDNDNSATCFIEGESEEQVLDHVYSQSGDYFNYRRDKILYRVHMDKVTYVSVVEYRPAQVKSLR